MKKNELYHLLRAVPFPNTPEGAAQIHEILKSHGIDPATLHQKVEMSSRFVDSHQNISYPGETFAPHGHPFHELVYCLTGSAEYLIGGEQYTIGRGDILSIPPGVSHTMTVPDSQNEPYRRYALWLSTEFSQLLLTMFLPETTSISISTYVLHTAGTVWEPLSDYFRRCVQECEQKQFRWETSAFGIATELLVQITRAWQGTQEDPAGKPELLDRIMAHVEAHLGEKITLPDIAARFWVSQSTVSQLFRKKMGISFYRYVTMRRLRESQLLIKGGMPMDQVSISVGFQDYSTFYRAFKAEYGISPAQFRKNH